MRTKNGNEQKMRNIQKIHARNLENNGKFLGGFLGIMKKMTVMMMLMMKRKKKKKMKMKMKKMKKKTMTTGCMCIH